jgi:glycerophosphoryl diester phosphodiesterase
MPFRLLFAENDYVHVCGHRGNSMNAPENTLPALESARRQGASSCEIDVVLSRDGEIVLSHDELLDRTTDGKGPVGEHDLAMLKALDAGAWFAPEFAGTRIPTLTETLERARSLGLGVVVEIKERRRVDQITARLRDVLEATQALEEVVLLSFDHRSLLLAKERIPGIRTEIITHARHVDIVAVAQAARADSISVELDMLHAEDASALAEAGVGIRCHLPQPTWLARHEAYGLDPTAELVTALQGGAITSISGDDVGSLREFLTAHGLPAPPSPRRAGKRPSQTAPGDGLSTRA